MTTWTQRKCDKCGARSPEDRREHGWAEIRYEAKTSPYFVIGSDLCPACVEVFLPDLPHIGQLS